jgi:hypothetical protein
MRTEVTGYLIYVHCFAVLLPVWGHDGDVAAVLGSCLIRCTLELTAEAENGSEQEARGIAFTL